jgi:hypothetical protein
VLNTLLIYLYDKLLYSNGLETIFDKKTLYHGSLVTNNDPEVVKARNLMQYLVGSYDEEDLRTIKKLIQNSDTKGVHYYLANLMMRSSVSEKDKTVTYFKLSDLDLSLAEMDILTGTIYEKISKKIPQPEIKLILVTFKLYVNILFLYAKYSTSLYLVNISFFTPRLNNQMDTLGGRMILPLPANSFVFNFIGVASVLTSDYNFTFGFGTTYRRCVCKNFLVSLFEDFTKVWNE